MRVHGCRLWSSLQENLHAARARACTHARSSSRIIPRVIPTCSLKSLFFICLSLARWLQVLIHQSDLSHRTPSHNEWMEPIQLPPPADTPNSALPAGETALKAGTMLLLHFICATLALWLDTCLLGGSNGFINVNRSLGRNALSCWLLTPSFGQTDCYTTLWSFWKRAAAHLDKTLFVIFIHLYSIFSSCCQNVVVLWRHLTHSAFTSFPMRRVNFGSPEKHPKKDQISNQGCRGQQCWKGSQMVKETMVCLSACVVQPTSH